jgi:nicotinamide-nucleotide amidase
VTDLEPLVPLAKEIIDLCTELGLKIVTAESCTGGLVAATLTEIAGSSAVVDRGLVTYSNEAKIALLDVPPAMIATKGAVSEEVARAMVTGALAHSPADLAVSVTGIAGPGGGTPDKPVGLVHFGAQRRGREIRHAVYIFDDLGRFSIRLASVRVALTMLRGLVS